MNERKPNQACTLMFFGALRAKPQLNPDAGQKMQRNCADEPLGKMFEQLTRKPRLPEQRHLVLHWCAGYLDATWKA